MTLQKLMEVVRKQAEQINSLSNTVMQLEARVEEVEKKRGPGRPPKVQGGAERTL